MTLGERIYAQRTAHSLSQTELAERLEVSRQSISKWETNASVPELDKLVKMCELFEVSMDELVRGRGPAAVKTDLDTPVTGVLTLRIVVALALTAFGLLALLLMSAVTKDIAAGLLLSLPFLICAALFSVGKRHLVLYCGWVVWVSIDIYLWTFEYGGFLWQLSFLVFNTPTVPSILGLVEAVFLAFLLFHSLKLLRQWDKKITEEAIKR